MTMSVLAALQSLEAMYDQSLEICLFFFLHAFRNISGMMVFPQVNDLQFSHWVEDVLAVVENLTDGPVVLV